jgi:hypothetical protein
LKRWDQDEPMTKAGGGIRKFDANFWTETRNPFLFLKTH